MNTFHPIYLDHAAATPLDERVLAAMQPYFSEWFYNPSSAYQPARDVRAAYEDARAHLARCIGAKPGEVVMTAGATESIAIAFQRAMMQGGHVVTAAIEHPAVLESAKKYDHTILSPTRQGMVTADSVCSAIRNDTRLVSVALANSELGTIQPLRDIAAAIAHTRDERLARGDKTPLFLHTDASQAAGALDIHTARLGVDMMTLNAGKCYGPKQVGLLWAASHVPMSEFIPGGGQEYGVRSGTENVAGVVGFAKALEIAEAMRKDETVRVRVLRDRLQKKLTVAFGDAVMINGSQKRRLPGHLHVAWPGADAERTLFHLERRGVLVATGSACAANKGTRSHVLTAIGLSEAEADGSIRFSLGRQTDERAVDHAAEEVIAVVKKELGHA